ncbi:MAG: hypothetical protein IIC26_07370 [Chloroflexi bacterium]|nr:hypothetical protein [Chloroflexota bacterium]
MRARGAITSDSDLQTVIERIDADIAMWDDELKRLTQAADWRVKAEEVNRILDELCQNIGPILDELTPFERREILETLVDKVWLAGDGSIRIEGHIEVEIAAGGRKLVNSVL